MPQYIGTINAQHPKAGQYVQSGFFNDLSSFPELVEKISRLPETVDKGAAFEVFAEAYLAIKRQNDFKRVWPLEAVPKSVREQLGIRLEDFGIDGVCLNHLGTYDVYQIKFRSDPLSVLNWGDVSTFYGLADAPAIESKILFSNCADVVSVIKERKNSVFILSAQLEELGTEDFRQIAAWLEGGKIEILKKQLRDDQLDAVNALNLELSQADRASCIMACGTGKTFVALKTLEERWANGESQKTVVFVPSLALLGQILDDWRKEGAVFKSLCVCSDHTVDDDIKQADCGFKVTTDAWVVRRFLDGAADLPKIVFSTYQSSPVIKEALAIKGDSFDLAIFDEAHRTAGRDGRAYSLALSDEHIRIDKRLFFTATPSHCNVTDHTEEGEFTQLYSMDDPAVYGRQVYTLSVRRAIELGIIAPYKVLVSVVTGDEVHDELLKRGETLVETTPVRARQVANQIALRDAIQQHGIKKVFTFHSRVASAESFVSKGDEGIGSHLDGFAFESINGTMSAKLRNQILGDFKQSDNAILSNARCLTEGVNVPSVDCVGLFAPLKSKVSVAQAMGRAMRKVDGKEFGYVLVPVYMELDEDLDTAAKRSKFDVVLDVLQTLKEQDETLAEELREIVARKVKGHDDTSGLQNVIFRIPVIAPDVPLGRLMEAIRVQCIDALLCDYEVRWQEKYQKTLRRKEELGDCNVTRLEDSELFRWQDKQRCNRKAGTLAPHRVKLLNDIGGFYWQIDEFWHKQFNELREFFQKNGHWKLLQDKKLRRFAVKQRLAYRAGKLKKERETLLNDIGFDWDPIEGSWDEMFERWCETQKTGAEPNRRTDNQLYSWIHVQRTHFKKGLLQKRPDRIKRLEEQGFIWEERDGIWPQRYKQYCQYVQLTGDRQASKAEKQLNAWVKLQRVSYRKGALAEDKMKLLNAVGFDWDVLDSTWVSNIQELAAWYAKTGNWSVSTNTPLGRWIVNTRARKTRLSQEKIDQLDQMGFPWSPNDDLWNEKFNKLREFYQKKGCHESPHDKELKEFAGHQRTLRRAGKLLKEREGLLNEIGFDWGRRTRDEIWCEMYEQYSQHVQLTGDRKAIKAAPKLRLWMQSQRGSYRKGRLYEERIKLLNALEFDWDPTGKDFWYEMYEQYCKHVQLTDDRRCLKATPKLRNWIILQRSSWRKGTLREDRIKLLNAIGLNWDPTGKDATALQKVA